jgi:hypothetical protein
MHAVTELHWQGKFRGIDFAAIPFRLEVGKTDKLKDSKGRLLWTVTAREITGTERDAAEDAGQKNVQSFASCLCRGRDAEISAGAMAASVPSAGMRLYQTDFAFLPV